MGKSFGRTNYTHKTPSPKIEEVINEKKEKVLRSLENKVFETAFGVSHTTAIYGGGK